MPAFRLLSVGFWPFSAPPYVYRTHLSCCRLSFMEDQPVEVVGQINQCEFRLRAGNTDGADEQAVAVLLVGKDMLDVSADG